MSWAMSAYRVGGPAIDTDQLIDALLCAWTAALWSRHGTDCCQILGPPQDSATEPIATIIAPARPEQRR
jgi:hypothetical protein